MTKSLKWTLTIVGAVVGQALSPGTAGATDPHRFSGESIATARSVGEFAVRNQSLPPGLGGTEGDLWFSIQRTKGDSDLYVQSNVWAPVEQGKPVASTGWHTHPGHSLIIVTHGQVTVYDGDDPACAPHVYAEGMAFVDAGGDHAHLIRNEGAEEARTVAVQLIPAGAARRIGADRPAPCSVD